MLEDLVMAIDGAVGVAAERRLALVHGDGAGRLGLRLAGQLGGAASVLEGLAQAGFEGVGLSDGARDPGEGQGQLADHGGVPFGVLDPGG